MQGTSGATAAKAMCGVASPFESGENQLVVDFVGEDDQVVTARQFGDLLEHLPRAQRACGIVGVDQHDAASARRELAFDVGEFGLPGVVFVEIVGVERDAQLAQNGRVERVVGTWSENVFAGIHQSADAEIDGFAYAGCDEDVAHGGDAFARGFASNRLERFWNAGRWRVAVLAVAHGFVGGFDDVRRSLEIEVERVADVQRQNFVSLLDDFVSDAGQVANGVADVVEALGGGDLAGLGSGHR